MDEIATGVSWLAVIVGAVVAFGAGWLWYSPRMFGEQWAEGVGVELGAASETMRGAMVMQVVGLLLMSWFVALAWASSLLWTAVLGALAFTVLGMSGSMFRQNSSHARNTDAGYWILALVIMVLANMIF